MAAPPALPPRNHSYEVRLEPLEPDLHEEHRALASGVYFTRTYQVNLLDRTILKSIPRLDAPSFPGVRKAS
jgi:hypothetical protein